MQRTTVTVGALALALFSFPGSLHAQDVGIDIGAGGEASPATESPPDAQTGSAAGGDTAPAGPQSDTDRARAEFALGIACIEQHETRCAIDHFRTALELHDAPAIRYNLASALFELEQYPEAARHVATVLADEEAPEDIRAHTETLHTQLQERGGTLAITVAGSAEGAEVQVDDDTIPPSQRASVIVAPGTRVVTLVRDDQELARQEVEVTAGRPSTVELVAPPTPEEVAAQADLETQDVPASEPAFYEEWPFWVIVGSSAALITLIVIAAVVATESAPIEEPVSGNYDPGILRWD